MQHDYTEKDLARMRYYLPELKAKLKQNPQSLCLINGIAKIEEVLGLPKTVKPIDPIKFLDQETERITKEKKGL
jgi:hypothetical protein